MPQTRDLLNTLNWESVAVPHARQREFTTRRGERYRLLIALPTQPPPPMPTATGSQPPTAQPPAAQPPTGPTPASKPPEPELPAPAKREP